jgi:hypothetical protein
VAAENVLTRKLGPLPTWGWVAIGGGGILLWAWAERKKTTATATTASSPGTDSSDLQPPYVFQVYPSTQEGGSGGTGKSGHEHQRHASRSIEVPNVIGEEYTQGSEKVTKAGLKAQRSSPFVGKVTRESPSAGTRVKGGSLVTLSGKPWPQSQGAKGGTRPVPKKKTKSRPGTKAKT